MKQRFCTTIALAFSIADNVVPSVRAQQTSSCDTEIISFCEEESNRYCFLDSESKPVCGNCLDGFIEWRARCLQDEVVDLDLFLSEYEPNYLSTLPTESRIELLTTAIQFIASYQNQNPPLPFELGLNTFSADSPEEALALRGFNATASPSNEPVPLSESSLVDPTQNLSSAVDWVEQGAVTAVKDQGRCGCCFANSMAGAIEGAAAIQSSFLQSLSVQQFVSCDETNSGCSGGSLVNAMAYALDAGNPISSEKNYPFVDGDGTTTAACDSSAIGAVTVTDASYVIDFEDDYTFEQRRDRMKAAVANQPVAMVLKSLCPLFTNYRSGVLTVDDGCSCDGPYCADHAVLLVGYNDDAEIPYWKIKNSWTTGWGEEGYVRIAQTQKGNYGLFGVLTHGIVPNLSFNLTDGIVTVAKPIKPKNEDEPVLEWWAWLLILLAACVLIFLLVSCFTGMLSGLMCPRKKSQTDE